MEKNGVEVLPKNVVAAQHSESYNKANINPTKLNQAAVDQG